MRCSSTLFAPERKFPINGRQAAGRFMKALYLSLLILPAVAWARTSEIGHPTFLSPHASPIVKSGAHVFTVNTPADTVDVIDASSREVVARIDVGIDPVGMAVRPDGKEIWVANHVSDSVSVIDAREPKHVATVPRQTSAAFTRFTSRLPV